MFIEKFSSDGVEGIRVNFNFTAQNNTNGVNFNPLSVFTPDAVAKSKLDLNHDFKYEAFDDSKTKWELKNSHVKGTEVEHEVFMESTDPATISVFTDPNFKGLSANLKPNMAPVPNRTATPRFYPDGGIELESFTALTKGTPSFKGADKVMIETFSDDSQSGVTIIEEAEKAPEVIPPATDQKQKETEKFSLSEDLQNQMIWVDRDIKELIEKKAELEIAIKALNGTLEPPEYFSEDKKKEIESFDQKQADDAEQKEFERINKNTQNAFKMKELGKTEQFSKSETVEATKNDPKILNNIFSKLLKK
jgi:hypothetical protein